jgi:ABC transporter substrate binding protein (PQQ-dependent alcohol dehydrogenase system)
MWNVTSQGSRRVRARSLALALLGSASSLVAGGAALAQAPPPSEAAAPAAPGAEATAQKAHILLVRELRDVDPPLSLLDLPPADDGVGGAKLAISDNNTTGRFLKQEFVLDVVQSAKAEELVAEAVKRAETAPFIVADLEPKTLLMLADALKDKPAIIFNAGSPDDILREEECRPNVLHTAPTRTMLADALGQYLNWKQWRNWFLISGPRPEDKAMAASYKRTAQRFGAKIVEEREFVYETGSRRSDGGHEQVQQQVPTFTQNAKPHDVVVVADEGGLFDQYLPYRTWDARPVVGTAGLVPASWHPAQEQWGGTQFQNRFKRMNNRNMRPLDYNVWMAVRSVGEAATRTKSVAVGDIAAHIRSKEFELAAFKGQKLTYRDWNGQLRQPIGLGTPKLPVTFSPQKGFLHQGSELDTLGIDKPESKCKAYAAR